MITVTNGLEALVEAERSRPDIILMDMRMPDAVGTVDYVTKPFNPPELLARVRTHLEFPWHCHLGADANKVDAPMKTALLSVCLIALTCSRSRSGVLTGPITNPANGHNYYLLTPQNWNAAEIEAKTLGGHLATVNDADENAWIFSTFAAFGGANRTLMIGLNDATVEGSLSGSAATHQSTAIGIRASR